MAYPSDLVRTKNWGTEVLTDSDLEGQFDLIINWVMASLNATTGHGHTGSSNDGPRLSSSGVTTTFGNGFTTVTAASGDYVVIASDVSDSNTTKKALVSDIVTLATPAIPSQTDMETATNNVKAVTPFAVNWHPGTAKGWVKFNGDGTVAVSASHNVTSVTDVATGVYTVNWTTSFSTANYAVAGMAQRDTGASDANSAIQIGFRRTSGAMATGSTSIIVGDNGGTAIDPTIVTLVAFGDQ